VRQLTHSLKTLMPNPHANLSPSAAERWISCPASVGLIAVLPRGESSSYAAEGTKAHALGELEASLAYGLVSPKVYTHRYTEWLLTSPLLDDEQLLDMQEHVAAYVELIQERMGLYPNSQLMLEKRVSTGIEQCWGTSDTVIVSPEHVEIIDLKYGMGVKVSAYNNPQLRLYGVGALEMFGDVLGDTKVVRTTVFQPRLDHTSTEELSAEELRGWRDSIIPIADEALNSPNPRFGPSEDACRWCPLAGECRARMEKATQEDFGKQPELLTPVELGGILERVQEIKNWCAAVEDTALRKAYSENVEIPGWKVVMSGGKRSVANEPAAIAALTEQGFTQEEIAVLKLKGIGDLEKIIKARTTGKKKDATLESVIGDLVVKGLGKPSLARENDAREAINPNNEAAKEFTE
jgi:hypothetical protein